MSAAIHNLVSALNTYSLIDYFMLPRGLFDFIMIYKQVDSIDNRSRSFTVLLHLNCYVDYSMETDRVFNSNALWSRKDETQIKI